MYPECIRQRIQTLQFPSSYYQRYLYQCPFIDYVCRVRRKSYYGPSFVTSEEVVESVGHLIPSELLTFKVVEANVDAGYLNFSKYNKPNIQCEGRITRIVNQMMQECFYPVMRDSVLVSDFEQLVSLLELKSSPGFPWNLYWQNKSLVKDRRFRSFFDQFLSDLQHGVFRVALFMCIVKEELKPLAKLLLNKVRVFTSAPLELTLVGYYLFADQNDRLLSACRRGLRAAKPIPCAIGWNKFNGNWDRFFHQLRRTNSRKQFERGYAFDISEWDSGCTEFLFNQIYALRWKCLARRDSETKNVLDIYKENVIHTTVVMDEGDIVQKHTGNCSGQVNTITDNSLILVWVWFYIFCSLKPSNLAFSYGAFRSLIALFVCGDDSILAVDESIVDWFNPQAIGRLFHQLGMKFKFASNHPEPIENLDFCSMRFSMLDGSWIPIPDTAKVISSLVCKNRTDSLRTLLLRALALRLECFFNFEAREVIDNFIAWCLEQPEVFSEPSMVRGDMFTLREILTLFKTYNEMRSLYLDEVATKDVERISERCESFEARF